MRSDIFKKLIAWAEVEQIAYREDIITKLQQLEAEVKYVDAFKRHQMRRWYPNDIKSLIHEL